ncbi:chitinase-3-like protein 2 isoform X1 [Cervus elaphus]|uniref:chitinase-3-like protein 2 isoform X1 n=1 Tax=Cervus elaphus TaxID=9860 RepID=UPI001CC2F32C|nr:chitinase-3-like protein 2 isoform X1 [Cervus elaphus]
MSVLVAERKQKVTVLSTITDHTKVVRSEQQIKFQVGLVALLLLQEGSAYKLVCYFTSWSQDRQEPGKFTFESTDPFLCSHLIYSFASISNNKVIIKDKNEAKLYQTINNLKTKNPKLKILLSIGGYLFGSKGFHPMVESSSSTLKFVNSVILFLRNHNFDGLDISWIYPNVKDNTHFTVLIHKLAEAFQQDFVKSTKERLLLTAGVSAGRQMIDNSYQIKELAKDLDFINLLSFDFHGSWEKPLVTGHNSPLRKGQLDRQTSSYYNVEYAVGYWIKKGIPAEKVVMGIPTYGRSFTLASAETAVGAPASGPGAAGPITKSSGFLAYYEICQFLQGAKITRLQDQQVPYAIKGNQWVGYDDVESVETKDRPFSLSHGLRGSRFLSLPVLWRRKWQPTPVFLPGKSHGQRSLAGYRLQGSVSKESKPGRGHDLVY